MKRQFKVAALGKGGWDGFTGIYNAVTCPDPKDYGLQNAQRDVAQSSDAHGDEDQAKTGDEDQTKTGDTKGKRKARATLGPDEVQNFIRQSAEAAQDQKKGLDFNSRMTLYKFTLDEYDKGRKIIATAMALLIVWVHPSLRGQLESFSDPKAAFDHLLSRYSVTDARAREMAENLFNGIYITRFTSAQNYINAIENAQQDILEAGGYCDDTMMISKIIRGLRGHPMYKDFATQYHLLRDIDEKFENLDHVITQLLTFESSNLPEPDFRPNGRYSQNGNTQYGNSRSVGPRNTRQQQRTKCSGCGIWGHEEEECLKTHPELRPQNKGPSGFGNRRTNNNYRDQSKNGYSGNNRDNKPNYMAATTIVDEDVFVNTLHHASVNSISANTDATENIPALQGITPMTPTVRSLAKTPVQANSLRGDRSESGQEEGVIVFEGESSRGVGVGSLVLSENAVFHGFESVAIKDVAKSNMRNTNGFLEPMITCNFCKHAYSTQQTCLANDVTSWTQETTTTSTTSPSAFYIVKDVGDAFLQAPYDCKDALEGSNKGLASERDAVCNCGEDLSYYSGWNEAPFDNDETLCGDYSNVCMAATDSPIQRNAWILDSGANVYVCNDTSWFTELYTFDSHVSTANVDSAMHIKGGGTVTLILEDGDGDPFTLVLNDVAYSPTSRCNLLSISKLARAGIVGSWNEGGGRMSLEIPGNFTVGNADLKGGLYHVKLHSSMPQDWVGVPFVANVDFTDIVWKEHRRLGHLSLQRMLQLCAHSVGMKVSQEQVRAKLGQICPICATTKAIVRIPKDPARVRHQEKGELVHVDIWGPYPVIGWDKTRWMCFITDDATRTTKTLRLQKLTDFPQLLRSFHKQEEKRYQMTIRKYRVDNQFNQGPWKDWCLKKGVTIDPIAPHAHHQVGVAERVNRTLREGASAMIQDNSIGHQVRRIIQEQGNEFLRNSTLPETLWPEAMDYAAWLKNRAPTRAHKSKKTPWEIEEGLVPDLSNEKTWGSRVYVSYTNEERGRKLHDPRGWLGYFVGCENESIYRVWNPDSKKVKRVAYSVVEDGQGLDDSHDGDDINNRVTWNQEENMETDTESDAESNDLDDDHLDEDLGPQGETDSKYFRNPAAMVTTRSGPRIKPTNDPVVTPPRAARVHDQGQVRPNIRFSSPSDAYEETYVPRLGDTLTASPYFKENVTRNAEQTSPYSEGEEPEESGLGEETGAPDAQQGSDEEFGDFTLPPGDDEEFGDFTPQAVDDNKPQEPIDEQYDLNNPLFPPIPTRFDDERTPNQLAFPSESESDLDDRRCENDVCQTPNSRIRASRDGPDGIRLCTACYGRYRRNPQKWRQGPVRVPRTCSNDMCGTPGAYVGPDVDSDGRPLCTNCHKRYRIYQTGDKPRGPNGWKDPQGYRNRGKFSQTKNNTDSSDSDEAELRSRFPWSRRGARDKKWVPDHRKCQPCFDNDLNCNKKDDEDCVQCVAYRHKCIPLKLNDDGSLPTKRRHSEAKIRDENHRLFQDRCHMCQLAHRKCDAVLPIDPKNPCTQCRKHNSYCISEERWQRTKNSSPCLRCGNIGKSTKCDRMEPCSICVDDSHAKCTYQSPDGTRWFTTLTNPIDPSQKKSRHDANADHYNPEIQGCVLCQVNASSRQRKGFSDKICSFKPGGPPCQNCFEKKSPAANRCTNWIAPGKTESVATRLYKRDKHTGDLIRDETLTRNESTKKSGRKRQRAEMSDSSDSDFETAHARIFTEDSRTKARERLGAVELPEAFLSAFSLTAISTPVDDALRPDPHSYLEAMKSPDRHKWKEAIQAEYDSLMENGTWEIAYLPPGRKALTTKWVLKKKLGPDGKVLKYKARMVARGFQQVEGYDYTETYSGVVKAAAYRLLFALMVLNSWTCHQMDVSTAFLNGEVHEEIYIHPPQGYPHPGRVLRLLKALYGLKQSPRLWYRKLRQWLLANGWQISKYDECVFYNEYRQLIITIYVDDINIFGPTDEHIVQFKQEIGKAFKMTDAGRASWYLGMQLQWQIDGLHIHQNGFIQQALGRYGLLGSRPATTPLDPTRKLVKETENTADPKFKTTYMSMVGSLNYLQTKTVWGLAFPVSLISRYMTNPNETHMDAVLQMFRYLAGNPERGLLFKKNGEQTLRGFVDSDWGGDTDTGKSTTGWVFTLAGSPVSWSSQRQKTVSSSSTEAEYIAASDACKEAVWLKGFHNEIAPRMNHPSQETIPLAIDNASALKLTKNPEFHGRTKHINIRHHFIRECVEQGNIKPEWISGKTNPADLFTKALSKTLFLENLQRLGNGIPDTSVASKAPDEAGVVLEGEH